MSIANVERAYAGSMEFVTHRLLTKQPKNRCSCTSNSPEPCNFCNARESAIERRMEEIASNQGFRLITADDVELEAIRSVAEIGFERWLKQMEAV